MKIHNNKLVSVLINCRNSERYIKEALDSVISQTYSNFEIILIDNQSTDQTKNIVKSYNDSRIKYFETKKHLSLGAARNLGLEFSKGKYIAFLDSDDFWEKTKLQKVLGTFENSIGIVYSDVNYFNKNKSFKLYSARNPYSGDCFNSLLNDYNLCMSSCVVSIEILNSHHIKFNQSLKVCEDLDFFIQIAYVSKVSYINEVLVNYRIHGENLTTKLPELFFHETKIIIQDLVDDKKINSRKANYLLDQNILNQVKFYWKNNEKGKAYSALLKTKYLFFKAILYGIVITFPYKLINLLYRPFKSVKIDFYET